MLSNRRRDESNLNSYNSQASDELNGVSKQLAKLQRFSYEAVVNA